MDVDPTVSRREIGTPTQKSLMIIASGTQFHVYFLWGLLRDCENRLWNRWIDLRHYPFLLWNIEVSAEQ